MAFGFISAQNLKSSVRGNEFTVATTSYTGAVRPDGTSITITAEGVIGSIIATPTNIGIARGDETSIVTLAGGILRVNTNFNTSVSVQGTTTLSGSTNIFGTTTMTGNTTISGTVIVVGATGTLFSVIDTSTGTLFGVNDQSGIPSLEVTDDGTVKIAQYGGNVGIGTGTPAFKLDVVGTVRASAVTATTITAASTISSSVSAQLLYAPGAVVQTKVVRSDTKVSYSAPVGGNTEIAVLTTTFTPKFSTSRIVLQWNIFNEVHHDAIFRVARNGSVIGNNTTDAGRWSGSFTSGYDNDQSSTPRTSHFVYVDTPGGTATYTYALYVGGSGAVAYTLWVNRPIGNAGADNQEVGISQLIIQEIAV